MNDRYEINYSEFDNDKNIFIEKDEFIKNLDIQFKTNFRQDFTKMSEEDQLYLFDKFTESIVIMLNEILGYLKIDADYF